MSLRAKAINGVLWNSIGKFSYVGIEFILGIILARLLSPQEFGLIATISIVIAVSDVFVNSGFSQAIVRKQDCTQKDYSTAFFFNLAVGILFFFILFFTAGPISQFFNNEDLKPLIQVLGIGLIIRSIALIQRAKLTKRIDFKLQTRISIIASIFSGTIAVFMAFNGFGVWSLVAKSLLKQSSTAAMLWLWNRWHPDLIFCMNSFKELFNFGSKLLLSGLLGTILQKVNYIVIAKYFTPQDLGYFTRAELFKDFLSENVSTTVTTVGYPTLAKIQNDRIRMKNAFREMFINTFYIIVLLMAGLAASAKALIITLVGNQWLPSVELLQMLCVVGLMWPLCSMNVNILNVVGRSDLYLKVQLISELLIIPNIFIGIYFGIKALIIGMIIINISDYLIFNHQSYKFIRYSIKEQLSDILPAFSLAIVMGIAVYLIGVLTDFNYLITLIIQVLTGIGIVVLSGEFLKMKEYFFLKNTLEDYLKLLFKRL